MINYEKFIREALSVYLTDKLRLYVAVFNLLFFMVNKLRHSCCFSGITSTD